MSKVVTRAPIIVQQDKKLLIARLLQTVGLATRFADLILGSLRKVCLFSFWCVLGAPLDNIGIKLFSERLP